MKPSYTVHYAFTRRFPVDAESALGWCLDYRADDWTTMGEVGTRRIRRLNDDTIILTDTVVERGGPVTKKRLVRVDRERLAWTNTHLSGPNLHSQFWYQIERDGKDGSRLEFVGLQVFYGKRPSGGKLKQIAEELRENDSRLWARLAKAMGRDLLGERAS